MMANTTGRRASTTSMPDDDKDFYDPIDTYGSDQEPDHHAAPASSIKEAASAHHPSQPSSPIATRAHQGFYEDTADDKAPQQTEGISRRSWEEYDSEEEDQYPVDAYDYGPEDDDYESDEYEERPSRRTSQHPEAAKAAPQPPPLSPTVSREQQQQQQQQDAMPASPVSQEQPSSPIQEQAYFQAPSSHQHDAHPSIHQEQYPDEPSSSSRRSSISSNGAADPTPPAPTVDAPAPPTPEVAHPEPEPKSSSHRHSYYEEESSEDEKDQYQYGAYDYDSYTNDDRDDGSADNKPPQSKYSDHESDSDSDQRSPPPATYDDGYGAGRDSARNSYLSASKQNDQRASLSSQRSYSSHTKHHSFGYDDRAEHEASESESESESESDSEVQHAKATTSVAAMAAAGAAATATVAAVAVAATAAATAAHKRPESPKSPRVAAPTSPISSRSRPTSFATSSMPSSPTMTRSAAAPALATATTASPTPAHSVTIPNAVQQENEQPKSPVETRSLRSPRSPISPRVSNPPFPSPISTIHGQEPKHVAPSHASSVSSADQHSRLTRHSSDSDTSGTSIDLQSPSNHHGVNGFGILKSPTFNRTMSGSSSSSPPLPPPPLHGLANGHADYSGSHKGASLEKQRPISYATVFSDAELNDISLDEPSSAPSENKRSSSAPKTPSTPSAFGFPSSFFGSKPHPMAQVAPHAPHPPAPPAPAAPAAPTAAPIPSSAEPVSLQPRDPSPPPVALSVTTAPPPSGERPSVSRSASISAVGSSISAAFGRLGNFASGNSILGGNNGSNSNHPNNNNGSSTSQRGSTTPQTPAPISAGIDLRRTSNVSPERASTLSTMTNDSNMDLLLARLEAQNEMLEQDNKRRLALEQEKRLQMEKAIGHAKEESTGETIDWDYWGALMNDYNGVVKRNPKQLTKMIQAGVPQALRGPIWQLLAKSKDAQLEASYAELLKASSPHEKQIHRDLSRTFPKHEYFQDPEGAGQEALFNVVKAYSLYDTEVGYCQGLSFVVGPLLLNMPDEEAFCVLARMMSTYEMRGHYTPDMHMLQLRLFQYEQLMEECVPFVYRHFQVQGIKSTMYASQWFMTLFAYKFPLDLVFRVFDIVFVEGVEALLRFAIALLKANHDRLLGMDFESLVEFLKNGLFETYTNDASMFIQDAYNVKVTPKKLAQYAQKYQAILQRQQQEQAAEESFREQNKQLVAQVKTLETSLSTLNKEHVDLAREVISNKLEMARLQDDNDALQQKVAELTKIVDAQGKDVEERFKGEIESVLQKNMEYLHKNQLLEDQLNDLENMLIETKMKYAESENERDALTRKLSDLRKALGVQ